MDATTETGFFLSKSANYYSTREIIVSFLLSQCSTGVSQCFRPTWQYGPSSGSPGRRTEGIGRRSDSARQRIVPGQNSSQFVYDSPNLPERTGTNRSRGGREMGIPVMVQCGRRGYSTRVLTKPTDSNYLNERERSFVLCSCNAAKVSGDDHVAAN